MYIYIIIYILLELYKIFHLMKNNYLPFIDLNLEFVNSSKLMCKCNCKCLNKNIDKIDTISNDKFVSLNNCEINRNVNGKEKIFEKKAIYKILYNIFDKKLLYLEKKTDIKRLLEMNKIMKNLLSKQNELLNILNNKNEFKSDTKKKNINLTNHTKYNKSSKSFNVNNLKNDNYFKSYYKSNKMLNFKSFNKLNISSNNSKIINKTNNISKTKLTVNKSYKDLKIKISDYKFVVKNLKNVNSSKSVDKKSIVFDENFCNKTKFNKNIKLVKNLNNNLTPIKRHDTRNTNFNNYVNKFNCYNPSFSKKKLVKKINFKTLSKENNGRNTLNPILNKLNSSKISSISIQTKKEYNKLYKNNYLTKKLETSTKNKNIVDINTKMFSNIIDVSRNISNNIIDINNCSKYNNEIKNKICNNVNKIDDKDISKYEEQTGLDLSFIIQVNEHINKDKLLTSNEESVDFNKDTNIYLSKSSLINNYISNKDYISLLNIDKMAKKDTNVNNSFIKEINESKLSICRTELNYSKVDIFDFNNKKNKTNSSKFNCTKNNNYIFNNNKNMLEILISKNKIIKFFDNKALFECLSILSKSFRLKIFKIKNCEVNYQIQFLQNIINKISKACNSNLPYQLKSKKYCNDLVNNSILNLKELLKQINYQNSLFVSCFDNVILSDLQNLLLNKNCFFIFKIIVILISTNKIEFDCIFKNDYKILINNQSNNQKNSTNLLSKFNNNIKCILICVIESSIFLLNNIYYTKTFESNYIWKIEYLLLEIFGKEKYINNITNNNINKIDKKDITYIAFYNLTIILKKVLISTGLILNNSNTGNNNLHLYLYQLDLMLNKLNNKILHIKNFIYAMF